MRFYRFFTLLIFSVIFLLSMTEQSHAATATTVGGMIKEMISSFSNLPNILTAFSFLAGLYMAISGIFKFKDHVDNPHQTKLSEGVKRFLAGGMFLSLSYMTKVLFGTLFGGGAATLGNTGRTGDKSGGTGMDHMIYKLMADIYEPMTRLLGLFAYIAAIILLIVAISRLIKTAQDGPRGPAGFGTIMTFIVAGVMFSLGDSMAVFSSSLFGSSDVTTFAKIDPSLMSVADGEKIASVVEAVMSFVMLVGYIAFIRGWFVMKAFADGQGNASIAQGLTFIFGGTLAINLGPFVNLLQESLGISSGSISFV